MRHMISLVRDRTANATVFLALVFLVLVGGAGVAVDTIQWTLLKRKLQRQADSAVVAGALAKMTGGSASVAATREINRYTSINLLGTPVIETPPTSGAWSGNARAIRVTVASDATLPFSNIFLNRTVTMQATATAAAVGFGEYCVLALETGVATGLDMTGNTNVDMNCGMATNAQGTSAASAGGSSYVVASPIAAVGGIPASNNFAVGTVLQSYSVAQPDPYEALPDPVVPGGCNSSLSVNPNQNRRVNNNTGVACYKDINIKGTVTFDPGIYYIDGGELNFSAQAEVTADGVIFILTSSTVTTTPSSVATVKINGGAELTITAPTSGTYSGLFIYQDPRAAFANNVNKISGNSSSLLQGGIYMPAQEVTFIGNSGMNTNCLQIVARRVTFTGSSTITNSCPTGSGVTPINGLQVRMVD